MASFEELKAKYQPVMDAGAEVGLNVQNLHTEGDKLIVRGTVPTGYGKNTLWDEIKRINPAVDDITADINVTGGTYTVQSGDTLSKIAKRYYGDAGEYNKIFQANTDKLSDPDQIKVGQQLTLPPE
jgi:nucleoid-associated protein YgaU